MKIINNHQSGNNGEITFTAHQRKIIQAWAKYPTIAEASKKLKISEHTFQTHLRRLRRKINVTRTFDVYTYMQKHQQL